MILVAKNWSYIDFKLSMDSNSIFLPTAFEHQKVQMQNTRWETHDVDSLTHPWWRPVNPCYESGKARHCNVGQSECYWWMFSTLSPCCSNLCQNEVLGGSEIISWQAGSVFFSHRKKGTKCFRSHYCFTSVCDWHIVVKIVLIYRE